MQGWKGGVKLERRRLETFLSPRHVITQTAFLMMAFALPSVVVCDKVGTVTLHDYLSTVILPGKIRLLQSIVGGGKREKVAKY